MVLLVSFAVLLLAAELGNIVRNRIRPLKEEEPDDFSFVLAACGASLDS